MHKSVFERILKSNGNHWWFRSRVNIFKYLLERINLKKKDIKILDFGTGVGANISFLKYFSKDISIFDKNKKMVKYLVEKHRVKTFNKNTKYDLILLTDVLEHIKNDNNLYISLLKNLNKKGYMLITVPAYQFLFSSKDKILHHYRRYNQKQLFKLCSNNKIIIKKITYYNFFLFIPISLIIILFKALNFSFIDKVEKTPNFFINYLLTKVFSFEKYILPIINFPFGLSLLAIIKKK